MPRKIVCRICDSERFRKVVVTLPSGKERVTDFDYCMACRTVFFRPEQRDRVGQYQTLSNFKGHVPVNMIAAMVSTFPDANTTELTEKSVHYGHDTFGRLVLKFQVRDAHHLPGQQKHWVLASAERFEE